MFIGKGRDAFGQGQMCLMARAEVLIGRGRGADWQGQRS